MIRGMSSPSKPSTESLFDADTGRRRVVMAIEEFNVVEWHPTPDASGPATAVALVFDAKVDLAGKQFLTSPMIRLKSRRVVMELIEALQKHADAVWPPEDQGS